MGYELRRQLREALGPDITGLQRAVALEIADDADEGTRRSDVHLDDLVRWTGAKDTNVVRNSLKRLAASGWEFRVPIGKGKDGRVLYAVPGTRMTFVVPPFKGVAPATPSPILGVAGAHSEGATATPSGVAGYGDESAGHPANRGAQTRTQGVATATPSAKEMKKKTSSGQGVAVATPSAPAREITAADKIEFGNFWKLHPKSQDIDTTRDAWVAAVLSGVDPKQITAAAVAYAHEKKGDEWRFIKSSHRWIKERRYLDRYAPNTTSKPAPPRDPRADWPPHCKDLECDEQTRYRRIEDANGLRSLIRCPDCHPSRKDSAA